MTAGFNGTFVISWSQTYLDGLRSAAFDALTVGAAWTWTGDVVRVDGPPGLLQLDQADGDAGLRKRAARSVRRLVGAAMEGEPEVQSTTPEDPLMDSHFVVTDGIRSYTVTVIEVGPGTRPLLMFLDSMPPRDTDLWVVHVTLDRMSRQGKTSGDSGVICFTPGTRISTPEGPIRIEDLCEGDYVQTRDNGRQQIAWIGRRRITGARMFVNPGLRPIRINAGALGIERPDQSMLVSPEHRMLVRGPAARALFNTSEVLVSASRLINGDTIHADLAVREVTYIHLLLAGHNIIWANGVETESFHPANASLEELSPADQVRLSALYPDIDRDPHIYGSFARRNLSDSEAAILMHEAA
ncbi:MAG: Hint domain-containing protein [Paracoccaceae bacterium]